MGDVSRRGKECRRPIDSRASTRWKINCGNARFSAISARWAKKNKRGREREREDGKLLVSRVKKIALLTRWCSSGSRRVRERRKGKLNGVGQGEFSLSEVWENSEENKDSCKGLVAEKQSGNRREYETEEWRPSDYRVVEKNAFKIGRMFKCLQSPLAEKGRKDFLFLYFILAQR